MFMIATKWWCEYYTLAPRKIKTEWLPLLWKLLNEICRKKGTIWTLGLSDFEEVNLFQVISISENHL